MNPVFCYFCIFLFVNQTGIKVKNKQAGTKTLLCYLR